MVRKAKSDDRNRTDDSYLLNPSPTAILILKLLVGSPLAQRAGGIDLYASIYLYE